MLRSRTTTTSSLQKIYEEGYLKCSTAVYYEGQGNEEEAMRCWRAAVEQIRHQCSETVLPDYATLSDSEKSLANSLRELEYQAQERVDILEALKLSRRDGPVLQDDTSNKAAADASKSGEGPSSMGNEGWIGGGTIPAVTYGELSRPLPPIPPQRSVPQPRTSPFEGNSAPQNDASSNRAGLQAPATPSKDTDQEGSTPRKGILTKRASKSPTHEKQHVLRPTLRTGNSGDSHHKGFRSSTSKSSERFGAGKAATLAWSALGLPSFKSEHQRASPSSEASAAIASTPTSPVPLQWDSNTRRLVPQRPSSDTIPIAASRTSFDAASTATAEMRRSGEYAAPHRPSSLSLNAAASALGRSLQSASESPANRSSSKQRPVSISTSTMPSLERTTSAQQLDHGSSTPMKPRHGSSSRTFGGTGSNTPTINRADLRRNAHSSTSVNDYGISSPPASDRTTPKAHTIPRKRIRNKDISGIDGGTSNDVSHLLADVQLDPSSSEDSDKLDDTEAQTKDGEDGSDMSWKKRKQAILKHLPSGVDGEAAKQILNEIVIQGDVVHWDDIAGLEPAKKALREAVVYPFLRPDLFMGLREPATGMLLFGPPGTGKTMLARAVATESKSTFFSISASSLTSKYLGESEKLVRALFALAKTLAPSIIFVDEIDSILSQRSGSGEHEATRRIKTEFLIQWSDLQRAAAGREDKDANRNGDASRVLVLAATNLPWAIDEAARRRFVRRQYIPLPEAETRAVQLRTLLGQQKHSLNESDIQQLVELTEGFSGSDITALAKDAAMGPLRSLGEALLMMKTDEIRPMELSDFIASLSTIRPSVSKSGLKEHEDWAREFGERGG